MSDRRLTFMCGSGGCSTRRETASDIAAEKLFEQWLQDYNKEHGEFPAEEDQVEKLAELYDQARKMKKTRAKKEDVEKLLDDERAQKEHILTLLRDSRIAHGTCLPRSRRACTACSAKEALDKILKEWKGPTFTLS